MALAGLPREVLDLVVRYFDHTSLLSLTSTSNYFYVLRSISNRERSLRVTDHFLRKSTLTPLALPGKIRGMILGYLDQHFMLNLRSTSEFVNRLCIPWCHFEGPPTADRAHPKFAAPPSPLSYLKAAKSAPWNAAIWYINGSRMLRIRSCDLPCFRCLRMRPQCEFAFKACQDFGTRECEACTGKVTTDEERYYVVHLDDIGDVYSFVSKNRCDARRQAAFT